MNSPIDKLVDRVGQLKRLAKITDRRAIKSELHEMWAEDLADAVARLEPQEAAHVLQNLDTLQAADILVAMPTEAARTIIAILPDQVVAEYLDELPMDDAIDLQEEIPEERFEALLELIPPEDASEIRRLMEYPPDSVGRLMTERFFHVRPESTVQQILDDLRDAPKDKYESVNDIYVIDEFEHLIGVISLRRVLRVPPATKVSEVMRTDVISSETTEHEETAARKMSRYGLYALPVVDGSNRMVGIFTGDDAQAILREYDTEDVLAIGAVSGAAEPYMSLNIWQLYKRRIPWLTILFVAEFFTGAVLRHYGQGGDEKLSTSEAMLFIPLLIGAGGNSGSQVTTTITRALALDEIRGRDSLRVLGKELIVALLVGGTLGLLGYFRAILPNPIGWNSDPSISLVVGLALPSIVLWSATVASLLPIGAKKLGIDPAVMSAPFITTLVDATGMIIYFEIALRILN